VGGARLGLAAPAALLLALVGTPAFAQAPPGGSPDTPPGRPAPPSRTNGDIVATLSSIGLEARFPAGTLTEQRETPNGPSLTAFEGGPAPRWSMLIQPIPASVDPPVARAQLTELLATVRSSGGALEPLSDRPVAISGRLGHVAVLRDPTDRPDPYLGMAVFPRESGGRALILISARGRSQEALEQILDATLASIRVRGPEAINLERSDHQRRATAMLAAADRPTLQSLVGFDQWYRTYRVDPQLGEVEIGCMRVQVEEGLRGAVDPNRDPRQYAMAEREPGFIVRVTGRFPVSEGVVRSSQAIHWMSWDQSSERWSVVATMRDARDRTNSEALTGVRAPRSAGNPRGSITVITARQRGATEPPAQWPMPDVVLPQPVRWLLGELLVATDTPPGVLGWYSVDASGGRPDLSYREDRWLPAPDGDGWVLQSRPKPSAAPTESLHDARGRLRLRVTPAGIRTEPIDLAELRRLWASKGLPTGPLNQSR
jgi:hypothetical protein